jgi:regulator of replication initiation timing
MTARKTSLIKGRVDHIAEELDRCRAAYIKLTDDSLFVAKTAQDMLDIGNNKIDRLTAENQKLQEDLRRLRNELHTQKLENEHLREENQRFQDAVDGAMDALEDQYDTVDGDDGRPQANAFMRIGQALEEALGRGGRYGL